MRRWQLHTHIRRCIWFAGHANSDSAILPLLLHRYNPLAASKASGAENLCGSHRMERFDGRESRGPERSRRRLRGDERSCRRSGPLIATYNLSGGDWRATRPKRKCGVRLVSSAYPMSYPSSSDDLTFTDHSRHRASQHVNGQWSVVSSQWSVVSERRVSGTRQLGSRSHPDQLPATTIGCQLMLMATLPTSSRWSSSMPGIFSVFASRSL